MYQKVLLAVGLVAGLAIAEAHAQQGAGASTSPLPPAAGTPVTRSPTLGDTGTSHPLRRVARRRTRPIITTPQNGNPPAAAAAGAR